MNLNKKLTAVATAALLALVALPGVTGGPLEAVVDGCNDVFDDLPPQAACGVIGTVDEALEEVPVPVPDVGPDAVTGILCGLADPDATDPAPNPVSVIFDTAGLGDILCVEGPGEPEDCPAGDETGTNFCVIIEEIVLLYALEVRDGGSGIDLGTLQAGDSVVTDSLEVAITGDLDTDTLTVDLSSFTGGPADFDATGQVCAYATAQDAETVDLNAGTCATFTDGTAALDLGTAELGKADESVHLVFDLDIPIDAQSGDYTAPVQISGTGL